jgi:hypothetical protein
MAKLETNGEILDRGLEECGSMIHIDPIRVMNVDNGSMKSSDDLADS